MATEVQQVHPLKTFADHNNPSQQQQPPTTTTMKTYNVYYTTSRLNATLSLGSSSDTRAYYAESKIMTTHPSLLIRAGSSKSSPLVACGKLAWADRNILIGTTDPASPVSSPEALHWEVMGRNRNRFFRGDYAFESSTGAAAGERKSYHWQVEGEGVGRYFKTVYKCLDEEGRVMANMRSGGVYNLKKGAEIDVQEGLEGGLEQLLVAASLSLWAAEAGWSVFQGYDSKGNKDKTK